MSTDVRDLAIRYAAAWAAHDVDAIVALHTEDTVFQLRGGGEPSVGWSATREKFAEVIEEWPDIRFEPKRSKTSRPYRKKVLQIGSRGAEIRTRDL